MVSAAPKCPICGKPPTAAMHPFCGKRCADIDLGRWLTESYAVPTDEGVGDAGEDET